MSGMRQLAGTVAVLHDMAEEGWPSMDQMGTLLTSRLPEHAPGLQVTAVRHTLRRVASRGPLQRLRPAFFADRVLNRMLLYPRHVRERVSGRFDIYHVVDHSYAQLALDLPGERTIVTCHDTDTFRSLVPGGEARPAWYRAIARRTLRGLRRARLVVCISQSSRDELVANNLVDPARIRVVPLGIDPALLQGPPAAARARAAALWPAQRGVFDLLHVGSDMPRKRLDRLVGIVAALRSRGHWVRLIRVGGPFRTATRAAAIELGLADIVELPFLDRDTLGAVYERSDLVLLTSDREGYGLPIIEAFAAGKPVVASDIPAIRETGAGLATYVAPDAITDWVVAVERTLADADPSGARAQARRQHAATRTWDTHVRALLPVYAELGPGATGQTQCA